LALVDRNFGADMSLRNSSRPATGPLIPRLRGCVGWSSPTAPYDIFWPHLDHGRPREMEPWKSAGNELHTGDRHAERRKKCGSVRFGIEPRRAASTKSARCRVSRAPGPRKNFNRAYASDYKKGLTASARTNCTRFSNAATTSRAAGLALARRATSRWPWPRSSRRTCRAFRGSSRSQ
jgi:hypothetical protein